MNSASDLEALRLQGQFRSSPLSRDDLVVHRFGGTRPAPVFYFVYRDVLDELIFASRYRSDDAFAVLTGGFGVADSIGFVEVTGFEELHYPDSDVDLVSFYLEKLRALQKAADDDVVVGLFASAPESAAVIPECVAHLHLSLFNVPFQPLLVVDADSDSLAIYGRAPRRTFVDYPLHVVSRIAPPQSESIDNSPESEQNATVEHGDDDQTTGEITKLDDDSA